MNVLVVASLLALRGPALLGATPRLCPDSVFFEFQVLVANGRTTSWIPDSTLAVHPVVTPDLTASLLQFVVDTAGVPEAASFHPLKVTDTAIVAEARRSFARWRFTPAVVTGCKVRQLMQAEIGR